MMRSRVVLAAALAIAAPLADARAQQKLALGHAAHPSVSVRLMAAVGDVRVIGWDRDSVDISGVVPTGTRAELSPGGPNAAMGMKMYVEVPSEKVARDGRLVMRVPRGARVWLKTGSAEIDVTGVTGGLDINVVGGSITVHGNPRELRAESMDGAVVVDGSPNWLRIKTATGDITVKGGQDMGASTISGTIRASGGEVERAKLEATTGSISFASLFTPNGSIELESHSGSIDVFLPAKIDVEVDAATITGAIDNQWTRARGVPGREGRGMTLTTSSGNGGGRVVARSFKGTIHLKLRKQSVVS